MYTNSNGTGVLTPADFDLTFLKNTGNARNVSIDSITKLDGSPLVGGETVVRVNLVVTGVPSGSETIEIKPISNTAIFNRNGIALLTSQTTNTVTLKGLYATLTSVTPAPARVSNYGNGTKGQYFFSNIVENTTYTVTGQLYYSDINTVYTSSTPINLTATRSEGDGSISDIVVNSVTGEFSFNYHSGTSKNSYSWDIDGVRNSGFWTNNY